MLAMLCTNAKAIPLTRVEDTLYNANGSRIEGMVTIQWRAFTAADGSTVAGNTVNVKIVQGVLAVDLTPNEEATPSGTSYQVTYLLDSGTRYTETWVVPASGSSVSVSQIRVSPPPPVATLIAQSQVSGLAAALDDKAGLNDANVFSEPQTIQDNGAGPTTPLFALREQGGSDSVGFRIPVLTESTLYTLPAADGASGQRLTTDGSGSLYWAEGGGSAYEVIQSSGAALTQRTAANFTNGLQASDNAGQTRTDIQPLFGSTAGTITQGNDPRLSDARDPLAHASTHAAAGSDPVTPGSIGALKNANDTMISTLATAPALDVKAAASQSAPVQQWLASDDAVLGSVSPAGGAFFREMSIATPIGGGQANQLFIVDDLTRFAISSLDDTLELFRYDESGVFQDKPLQIFRDGGTQVNTSLVVSDARPTVGATNLAVKAGQGQGATALQQWQNNAGATLSGVDAAGNLVLDQTYVEVEERSPPAAPATGRLRLFLDSSTGELSVRKDSGTVISLEAGAVVFHDAEVPGGTIDGVNDEFTLATAPSPAASLQLIVNGVTQKPGVDFTLSSNTITFVAGAIPQAGDELLSWYRAGP
jgi:hypothetical protein